MLEKKFKRFRALINEIAWKANCSIYIRFHTFTSPFLKEISFTHLETHSRPQKNEDLRADCCFGKTILATLKLFITRFFLKKPVITVDIIDRTMLYRKSTMLVLLF